MDRGDRTSPSSNSDENSFASARAAFMKPDATSAASGPGAKIKEIASIFDSGAAPVNAIERGVSRSEDKSLKNAPSVSKVASIFEANIPEKEVEPSPEKTSKERFANATKMFSGSNE